MKKLLAIIMVVAMVASFASVVSAANDNGLIAHYTFDGNKADSGLDPQGTELEYADGAVTLGGAGNTSWLKSGAALSGVNAITIGMKVKLPKNVEGGGQWIYDITSQDTHDGQADGAFGFAMYYEGDEIHAQVYAGCGSPVPATAQADLSIADLPENEFVTVVVTYSADKVLTLYVGDKKASVNVETDASLSDIFGSSPVFQIGRCSWGGGFYARTVAFDEIVVYGRALTEAEIANAFTVSGNEGGNGNGSNSGTGNNTAPQTGFATVALAVAAIGSGAYIVLKKRH